MIHRGCSEIQFIIGFSDFMGFVDSNIKTENSWPEPLNEKCAFLSLSVCLSEIISINLFGV